MIITIDGPAGSGKSTVARALSRELSIPYLNSGAIYRALTLAVLESGGQFERAESVQEIVENFGFEAVEAEGGLTQFFLHGREVTHRLKDPDVTREIFRISDNPLYRTWLVDLQRQAVTERGIVAEGRDMGTVIFPDAEVKFFLEAPVEERARRQHEELKARGVDSSLDDLIEQVRKRDGRDRNRAAAPLRIAPDAIKVDSGQLSVDEVLAKMIEIVREKGASGLSQKRETQT